jgi:hypothetical protein
LHYSVSALMRGGELAGGYWMTFQKMTEALELFKANNPLPEVWQCQICGCVVKAPAIREYEPNTHCVHPSSWFGTEFDIACDMIRIKVEEDISC